jgi:hypothetical protein
VRYLLFIAVLLFAFSAEAQTNRYVCNCDTSSGATPDANCVAGSDGNDGLTTSTPWQNLETARSWFVGHNAETPGNIHFCDGGSWNADDIDNEWLNPEAIRTDRAGQTMTMTNYRDPRFTLADESNDTEGWPVYLPEIKRTTGRLDQNVPMIRLGFSNYFQNPQRSGNTIVENLHLHGPHPWWESDPNSYHPSNNTWGWGIGARGDVDDVIIRNNRIEAFRFGINVRSHEPEIVDQCVGGGAPPGCNTLAENVDFDGNLVIYNAAQGYFGGAYGTSYIRNNTFRYNGGANTSDAHDHHIYISADVGEFRGQADPFMAPVSGHFYIQNNDIGPGSGGEGPGTHPCGGTQLSIHAGSGYKDGITIEDNHFWELPGLAGGGCYGIGVLQGYQLSELFDNILIRRNLIENVGSLGIGAHATTQGLVIENNIIISNTDDGHNAISVPGRSYWRCVDHDNNDATPDIPDTANFNAQVSNAIIRNNLAVFNGNDDKVFINLKSSHDSDCDPGNIANHDTFEYHTNGQVYNNIGIQLNPNQDVNCFVTATVDPADLPTQFSRFDNNFCYIAPGGVGNLFWSPESFLGGGTNSTSFTLSTWQALAAGFDASSSNSLPDMVDLVGTLFPDFDFRPDGPSSNLVDAGTNPPPDGDYDENARDATPDIGPYEFQVTGPTERYIVDNGNWNEVATWSETSGGPDGASVPGAGNEVFLDAAFTVTLTADATVGHITQTAGTLALAGNTLTSNSDMHFDGGTITTSGTTSTLDVNVDIDSVGQDWSSQSGLNLVLSGGVGSWRYDLTTPPSLRSLTAGQSGGTSTLIGVGTHTEGSSDISLTNNLTIGSGLLTESTAEEVGGPLGTSIELQSSSATQSIIGSGGTINVSTLKHIGSGTKQIESNVVYNTTDMRFIGDFQGVKGTGPKWDALGSINATNVNIELGNTGTLDLNGFALTSSTLTVGDDDGCWDVDLEGGTLSIAGQLHLNDVVAFPGGGCINDITMGASGTTVAGYLSNASQSNYLLAGAGGSLELLDTTGTCSLDVLNVDSDAGGNWSGVNAALDAAGDCVLFRRSMTDLSITGNDLSPTADGGFIGSYDAGNRPVLLLDTSEQFDINGAVELRDIRFDWGTIAPPVALTRTVWSEAKGGAVGMNVEKNNEDYPGPRFLNHMKSTSPWIETTAGNPNFTFDGAYPFASLTADDYPTTLSGMEMAFFTFFETSVYAETPYPLGEWVMLFDGANHLWEVDGPVENVQAPSAGRVTFDLIEGNGPVNIGLTQLGASGLTNLRLYPPGGSCVDDVSGEVDKTSFCSTSRCPGGSCNEATACSLGETCTDFEVLGDAGDMMFHPLWLRNLGQYRGLRFLNWLNANHAGNVHQMIDYPTESKRTWRYSPSPLGDRAIESVPLAAIAQLCNDNNSECYVNMPEGFDDIEMEAFLQYFRDNVNSNIPIVVELANEIWNPSLNGTADDMSQDAYEFWLANPLEFDGADCENLSPPDHIPATEVDCAKNWQGKRTYEMCAIGEAVFAGLGQQDRFECVLGSRITPGDVETALDCTRWTAAPNGNCYTGSDIDSVGINAYVGSGSDCSGTDAQAACDAAQAEVDTQYCTAATPTCVLYQMKERLWTERGLDWKIIAYEGGSHLNDHVTEACDSIVIDADSCLMTVYDNLLDAWRDADLATNVNIGSFYMLVNMGELGRSIDSGNNFGHRGSNEGGWPKEAAILDWVNNSPANDCWWTNCSISVAPSEPVDPVTGELLLQGGGIEGGGVR